MKKNVLLVVKNKKRRQKNLLMAQTTVASFGPALHPNSRLQLLLVRGWAWEWQEWVLTEWRWL
jgi:hypothetical protein